MFVAVVGVLAVILIAAVLCRGYPVARVLFGGGLCLLGLLLGFSDEQQEREMAREIGLLLGLTAPNMSAFEEIVWEYELLSVLAAFGAFLFGGWMIISAWEADETRRRQSGEWVVRRQQLRDALASETEPGKIALLKHDLERHEANAPDESHIREALAAAEEKKADGARGN